MKIGLIAKITLIFSFIFFSHQAYSSNLQFNSTSQCNLKDLYYQYISTSCSFNSTCFSSSFSRYSYQYNCTATLPKVEYQDSYITASYSKTGCSDADISFL